MRFLVGHWTPCTSDKLYMRLQRCMLTLYSVHINYGQESYSVPRVRTENVQ